MHKAWDKLISTAYEHNQYDQYLTNGNAKEISERSALYLVADAINQGYSPLNKQNLSRYGFKSKQSLFYTLNRLVEKQLLIKNDDKWTFADPIMEGWFAHHSPFNK